MRKYKLVAFGLYAVLSLALCGCGLQKASLVEKREVERNPANHQYVYQLPYETDRSYLLVQGYKSIFSHRSEYSFDFKMKIGTKVFAAREGIVEATESSFNVHGLRNKYLNECNYVIIKHNDGTFAAYRHLKKDGVVVKPGEIVAKGQLIGYSGHTGYSAFPHLHFMVFRLDENNRAYTFPTRFKTNMGDIFLKPGSSYINKVSGEE